MSRRCEMYTANGQCKNEATKQTNIGGAIGKMWICEQCLKDYK